MKTSSTSNNQYLFTPSMRNVFNPNLQDASVVVELQHLKWELYLKISEKCNKKDSNLNYFHGCDKETAGVDASNPFLPCMADSSTSYWLVTESYKAFEYVSLACTIQNPCFNNQMKKVKESKYLTDDKSCMEALGLFFKFRTTRVKNISKFEHMTPGYWILG